VKRLLAALLLAAWPAAAQRSIPAAPCKITDGSCAPMPNATTLGCAANSVAVFLGTPVALSCDGGLTYDATTDVLTAGALSARNVTATALATPGAITVTPQGTGGAVTWTYKLVARLADGTTTEAGAASSTAVGNATLSAGNFNRLAWSAVTGATDYRVYRTVAGTSPATTGIIYTGTALTVDDTGLAGGGETAPTTALAGVVRGLIRAENGSEGKPSLGFATPLPDALPAPGFYKDSSGMHWSLSGIKRGTLASGQLRLDQDTGVFVIGESSDTGASRGAAGQWNFGASATSGAFNGTTKRATDIIADPNGATWTSGFVTELTTIAASATTDTTIELPANAVIRAVVGKVTVAPPGTATMTVGDPTTAARFATGISTALNTTFVGLIHVDQTGAPGPKQTTAAKVRYTPNASPSDATGRIRTTIFYDVFVPPST